MEKCKYCGISLSERIIGFHMKHCKAKDQKKSDVQEKSPDLPYADKSFSEMRAEAKARGINTYKMSTEELRQALINHDEKIIKEDKPVE